MQLCIVILVTDGLSVRWEDESKSLQASVFLRKEVLQIGQDAASVHVSAKKPHALLLVTLTACLCAALCGV